MNAREFKKITNRLGMQSGFCIHLAVLVAAIVLATQFRLDLQAGKVKVEEDKSITPDLPAYDGPKAAVAIGKFDWAVGNGGQGKVEVKGSDGSSYSYSYSVESQNEMVGGLADMLASALLESNRFQVLESIDKEALKEEIDLGESGYVEKETAVEKGNWIGTDLILLATITEWQPDAGGKSIGLGGLSGGLLGGVKVGKKKAKLGMNIKVVDAETRVVVVSKLIKAETSKTSLGVGGGGFTGSTILGGVFSQYENTPMGTCISTCIAEAVKLIAEKTPKAYFKY